MLGLGRGALGRARLFAAIVAANLAISVPGTLWAQTTWTAGNNTTDWTSNGNWTANAPAAGNPATLNGGGAFQPALPNDVNAGTSLSMSGNTLSLNGHTLTLTQLTMTGGTITGGGGTVAITGAGSTISGAAGISSDTTISSAGSLLITGPISLSNAFRGTGAITTSGNVTLTSAVSNYSGGTTITSGTLNIGSASAVGTGTVSIGNNATLQLGASFLFANNVSLAAAGTAIIDTNGNSSGFDGIISGAGSTLIKTGADVLSLNGANTYTGGTTINGGTLKLGTGGSLASTGALTVNTGGSFDLDGQDQTVGSLSGTGGTVTNSTAATTSTLTIGDATNTTYSGVIQDGAGTLALIKQGSGTLTLGGINTYTGTTTINAGALSVNGSITSNVTVNAGGALQGTGNITGSVTVAGNIAPGNSIGTLTITGPYVQTAGSTYTVEVNAAGQSDKIAVTGTATLAGTLSVQAAVGKYQRLTNYTVLTATSTTGGYSSVTSNMASLVPTVSIGGGTVTLTLLNTAAVLPGSDTGSFTGNQSAVAHVLNQTGTTTTSGDLNNVLNALFALSSAQVGPTMDVLGGQNYSGFSSLAMQGSQLFMDSFEIQAGGAGGSGGANLAGGSTYMALRTDSADSCDTACDVEPLWGAWGGGVGAFGTVAGDGNSHGLTYNLGGFIAGLDRKVVPDFRAGVAVGFNAATLYTQGMPGTGTSNTLQFALYGEYLAGPLYLDTLAGYGHSDNRMNRPIVIPGLPFRMAQGYTTANTFFGQFEAGYKVTVAPSFGGFVAPFARLQASTSTQMGFSETGADSLNLTIAQQTTQSLRTVLGAQLGASIDAPWREKLDLTLRLGWSHEYADLTRPVSAAFAGAPALGFTTFGAAAPRDGVVLGFGAKTAIAERTSLYFRYDGDLAGANTNHVLNAGVRYVW